MGNAISPCFHPISSRSLVKLIFWEGTTRVLTKKMLAGEVMFEFPDRMICHADSFYIGHPIPALAIDDKLKTGQTYFVLPLDCITSNVLSASSLAALGSSSPKRSLVNFKECPFEYIKGSNGRVSIKVVPEFITKILTRGKELTDQESKSTSHDFICSTPELKKHYDHLVGSGEQVWSPKLESISEYKIRFSPLRFIGLEWKQKENDV
ncbi:DNA-directed RNA polymerase [Actinidia chinensis var. chinensis]|uniref:DNA-directed RNA polymerase n=1 Tax=Actinidia chinensis var. chinensis TaxID=1590841 RepID=A0A2R6P808_ACTCC|nr:DNA-directed RNA polymerase [Actinidia chinensis var. chinensis]